MLNKEVLSTNSHGLPYMVVSCIQQKRRRNKIALCCCSRSSKLMRCNLGKQSFIVSICYKANPFLLTGNIKHNVLHDRSIFRLISARPRIKAILKKENLNSRVRRTNNLKPHAGASDNDNTFLINFNISLWLLLIQANNYIVTSVQHLSTASQFHPRLPLVVCCFSARCS